MDLKKILAGEVAAALHGVDGAMKAREEFAAQFSGTATRTSRTCRSWMTSRSPLSMS